MNDYTNHKCPLLRPELVAEAAAKYTNQELEGLRRMALAAVYGSIVDIVQTPGSKHEKGAAIHHLADAAVAIGSLMHAPSVG